MDPVKRSYDSTNRQTQARANRRAVIHSALELFAEQGFAATTIQAIAERAGVSVQTVYAGFGNKRELLRQALEASVVGEEDVAPINDGQEAHAIADEPDPRRRAELDAAVVSRIAKAISPIVRAVREAAAVDPEFAATSEAITVQRRTDMERSAHTLAGDDGLKVPLEEAIGTLYVLYGPDTYLALTEDLGWSMEQYERWLGTMLYRTLLA